MKLGAKQHHCCVVELLFTDIWN